MKIAFDISQTGTSKAGCGYFAYALANALPALAPDNNYYFLQSFGDFFFDAALSRKSASHKNNIHTGPHIFSYETAKNFWNAEGLEASLERPDIIHSNNYWCPTQIKSSRLVYTLYDLSFLEQPEWTTEANRTGCFDGVFQASIAADWIIAISKSSRDHFLKFFPHFPQDRLRVIYPASRFTEIDKAGIRPNAMKDIPAGQFWLSVGTIEPRKNQNMLIEAYARYLALGGFPMPLVFAGGSGWKMDDFTNFIDSLGLTSQIIMTGYVSDDELIWLYRNCYANLYPSFFEGFGLPVLEGMQFGAPTITSDSTSLPEVTGDAAILIEPENMEAWSQALLQLSSDKNLRNQFAEKSLEQASRFTWESSASMLLDLYMEAMVLPKLMVLREINNGQKC
jgi:glycosyltransferase involved in cell wall biosynthesis